MTRGLDRNLKARLARNVTRMAMCWRIRRVDGAVEGYTSHDRPLTFAGVTFMRSGVAATTISESMEAKTGNLEVHGLLDFTLSMLDAKAYQNAQVEIFEADYAHLPAAINRETVVMLKRGVVGDVFLRRGAWVLEIRDFKQYLKQAAGMKTSRLCRAELGDSDCRANLSGYIKIGTITGIRARSILVSASIPNGERYVGGRLDVLAKGVSFDILSAAGGAVTVGEDVPAILIGQQARITPGCNKWVSDCVLYNNLLNYQGEPHVPTEDEWASGINGSTDAGILGA